MKNNEKMRLVFFSSFGLIIIGEILSLTEFKISSYILIGIGVILMVMFAYNSFIKRL